MCCVGAQGFLLESDYEGDNGHPRMAWINPSFAANSVLVPGDVLLEINGKPATSHTQAAKVIAAIVGDVVLKVLAQKPRGGRTTLETIDAAAGVDAGVDAATKVQSLIRGQQSRKVTAKNAPEPVPAEPAESVAAEAAAEARAVAAEVRAAEAEARAAGAEAKASEAAAQVAAAAAERVKLPGVKVSEMRSALVRSGQSLSLPATTFSPKSRSCSGGAGLKNLPPGMPPRPKQEAVVTTDTERDAAAKESAATTDAEQDAAAAKMQSLIRGQQSRKEMDSAPDAPLARQESAATTDAKQDAAAAKMQSLTRGRHSRKKIDSAPNAPPAEQEEMGTDELEAAAQEGGPEKHRHRSRRSVKAIEEHRHRRSAKPKDVGAESSLAELSLAEAPPNRHRHRRRSTRKTEELDGEADRAEEGTQHQPTQPTLNAH